MLISIKKYQEVQHFIGSDKLRMLFFMHINGEMPKIFGILTLMNRKIFVITSGPDWFFRPGKQAGSRKS